MTDNEVATTFYRTAPRMPIRDRRLGTDLGQPDTDFKKPADAALSALAPESIASSDPELPDDADQRESDYVALRESHHKRSVNNADRTPRGRISSALISGSKSPSYTYLNRKR